MLCKDKHVLNYEGALSEANITLEILDLDRSVWIEVIADVEVY